MRLDEQQEHTINTKNTVLQLSAYFIQAFPEMNKLEQQIALTIYRSLALLKPVTIESISKAINQNKNIITKICHSWPGVVFDNNNHIIGFWGITNQQMPHHMIIDQRKVYTWCAWDTLFIPQLINVSARVHSECPVTKQNIELLVSPTHVKAINNQKVVMSFLKPDMDDFNNDITASFCHFVFFFANHDAGEQWCAEHPNTFLLSLDDAFSVGTRMNAVRYNLTLK